MANWPGRRVTVRTVACELLLLRQMNYCLDAMTVHDKEKSGRLVREMFPVALMSDTRWRQVIEWLDVEEPGLGRVLVKFIDVDQPREITFPPGLQCPHAYMDTLEFGPVELRAIEWMQFPADISGIVETLGKRVPLEPRDGGSVIVGYRR